MKFLLGLVHTYSLLYLTSKLRLYVVTLVDISLSECIRPRSYISVHVAVLASLVSESIVIRYTSCTGHGDIILIETYIHSQKNTHTHINTHTHTHTHTQYLKGVIQQKF